MVFGVRLISIAYNVKTVRKSKTELPGLPPTPIKDFQTEKGKFNLTLIFRNHEEKFTFYR